jgi:L-asparaginase/archaeal Glu-tRNAGln amidotransferase subunit D
MTRTVGDARTRRLLVVHTGGTIETQGVDRLDLVEYVDNGTAIGPEALWASVPELRDAAITEHLAPARRPSHAWSPDDWLGLSVEIRATIASRPPEGIVVVTGTNTLEELAFFLDLVLQPTMPVVVTGSMRPASSITADGPLNLFRAAQVALDPASAGRGVLVVANESIFLARDVTKTSTYAIDAFRAPCSGPVGSIGADHRVRYDYEGGGRSYASHRFESGLRVPLPRVEIIASYPGADGMLIDAAVAAGSVGLFLAGTGAGYPTPAQATALSRAMAMGVVVCISTRAGSGRVLMTRARRASGFLVSGSLGPWKARLLLMACLAMGDGPEELQRIFDEI